MIKNQSLDDNRVQDFENNLCHAVHVKSQSFERMNITDRMKYYKVPGVSLTVIEDFKVLGSKSYGVMDTSEQKPLDMKSRFQAASISKPVAALGALQLVEKGLIDLDEDISPHLYTWKIPPNDFTREEKVSLRGLLTHTAGFNVHGFRGYAHDETLPTVMDILKGNAPANSEPILVHREPGQTFQYSGGGYTLMQLLVEEISGISFERYMQVAVLQPLGMRQSAYRQPLDEDDRDNVASGHLQPGEVVPGKWHTYPELAAAGLWTTPFDLAKYLIAIQKGWQGESGIIPQSLAKDILTMHTGDRGLGPALGGEDRSFWFGHGGSNEGFRCMAIAFPETGQGIVVMTNSDNGVDLYWEIIRSAAEVFDWPEQVFRYEVKPADELDQDKINKLCGTYQARDFPYAVQITLEGNSLSCHMPDLILHPRRLYPDQGVDNSYFAVEDGSQFIFREIDGKVSCEMTTRTIKFDLEKLS